jgi:hypothetical protein
MLSKLANTGLRKPVPQIHIPTTHTEINFSELLTITITFPDTGP